MIKIHLQRKKVVTLSLLRHKSFLIKTVFLDQSRYKMNQIAMSHVVNSVTSNPGSLISLSNFIHMYITIKNVISASVYVSFTNIERDVSEGH